MRTTGAFLTQASAGQLRTLLASPTGLETIATLRHVVRTGPETLSMLFTPVLALGPVPLETTVVTTYDSEQRVDLAVRGRRGSQVVDVTLVVELGESRDGTAVSWTADVAVRGVAASVGQRVAGDLAGQAISDVLKSSAEAARGASA